MVARHYVHGQIRVYALINAPAREWLQSTEREREQVSDVIDLVPVEASSLAVSQ